MIDCVLHLGIESIQRFENDQEYGLKRYLILKISPKSYLNPFMEFEENMERK